MMSPGSASGPKRGRAWLSRGVSELFDGAAPSRPPHFDVLIVGSGYGGAIAAAMLAGSRFLPGNGQPPRKVRIGLLERGDEYLPGSFPSELSELPGHVRFCLPGATSAKGVRWGLFDVRVGADVVTVVANGLGGGSLINAGVMLQPLDDVLAESAWPSAIRSDPGALGRFYNCARDWLGVLKPTTVAAAGMAPPKLGVMKELGGSPVPITVALESGSRSSAGVTMNPCLGCGDCATGCNHGAKESLDVNLLVHARRAGVEIYTGATVLRLEGSVFQTVLSADPDTARNVLRTLARWLRGGQPA